MPSGKVNRLWFFHLDYYVSRILQSTFPKSVFLQKMISSYIKDFFGDPIRTGALQYDKNIESLLLENVIEIGNITNTRDNLEKCSAPVRRMAILGIMFDSVKI